MIGSIRNAAFRGVFGCAAVLWLCMTAAVASPWAEVGDAQLRSDIAVLSAAGAIDNITMQWPLPWAGILYRLEQPEAVDGQPDYVRDAAMRVRARGMAETHTDKLRASITVDATNGPDVVRGYDALGRQTGQGQATLEYLWDSTAVHLAVGAQTTGHADHQTLVLDGSYVAQRIGNAAIYAGYMTHWWGPGWISALQLSNNARPIPQIGISRVDTAPFESSWLRWIGPWQAEFFVGVLDDPRIARHTIYSGLRFAVSPIPHLEFAFSRTSEMCGTGHQCKPLAQYIYLTPTASVPNKTNDEGSLELRYSGAFDSLAYEIYTQFMNEDVNPFVQSGTSHLFGASVWLPIESGVARLTFEYASSLATQNMFSFGNYNHGFAYNNYDYLDGMHYRGRTLGFSLDSDSQLLSIQANYTDVQARSFTLTYHRATVSDPLNHVGNVVTTVPVLINLLEARTDLPFRLSNRAVQFSVVGRLQDDQPRPAKGYLATIEASLRVGF